MGTGACDRTSSEHPPVRRPLRQVGRQRPAAAAGLRDGRRSTTTACGRRCGSSAQEARRRGGEAGTGALPPTLRRRTNKRHPMATEGGRARRHVGRQPRRWSGRELYVVTAASRATDVPPGPQCWDPACGVGQRRPRPAPRSPRPRTRPCSPSPARPELPSVGGDRDRLSCQSVRRRTRCRSGGGGLLGPGDRAGARGRAWDSHLDCRPHAHDGCIVRRAPLSSSRHFRRRRDPGPVRQ